MEPQTPVSEVSRPLKMYASRLKKLGITTIEDFLYHVPARYDDFSLISRIASVQAGEVVTIKGTVLEMKNDFTKRFKKVQKAIIVDESGGIEATWFNQPFLAQYIKPQSIISLSGTVTFFGKTKTLISPSYEILSDENQPTLHTGRLVPIYPETAGVSSKWLRRQVYNFLKNTTLEEYLSDKQRELYDLMELSDAVKTVHFPHTLEEAERARKRLAFDELLTLQLKAKIRRERWEKSTKGNAFVVSKHQKQIDAFWEHLPFTLTAAQNRAIHEVFGDTEKEKPMNRLLQGDVGSGKTVVAAATMYLAFLNGFQSVLMAPTEILAQQHYKTISQLLTPLGVKVDLITGSQKTLSAKSKAKNEETFDVLIGTHAVLYGKVSFHKLGLVVIDEQQRFGVAQRSLIRQKGNNPHVLTMTATPIPRTVALTMYGDLDLSYLDEMPKGRRVIKTWLVPKEKRDNAYEWIRKQIQETDSQVFIICPFIEQSETMQTVKAASVEFDRLKNDVFPDLPLGLLHGRLKGKEKHEALLRFRNKEFSILVATPVVEVGIDIPNATVIVIEASERFGLAQLHQLRGRVGRGDKQSYCLLFTETHSERTMSKLKSLETIHVGAQLAELDLRLRGPGELYGTLQSGIPELKIASFSDVALVQKASRAAETLYATLEENPKLRARIQAEDTTIAPD